MANLAVYYTDDTTTDLTNFNKDEPKSEYTVNVAAGHTALNVAAEAADENAIAEISWALGVQTAAEKGGGTGKTAELPNIPLPSSTAVDLVISVTVSKDGKTQEYLITVKALGSGGPPVETSLTALSVKYASGSDATTELLSGFASGKTDYEISFTNEADAGRGLTITATAKDTTATVTITGSGSVTIPDAGGSERIVTVTVTQGTAKTDYRIAIIPPQSTVSDDKNLQGVTMVYGSGAAIPSGWFNSGHLDYVHTVPNGETKVRISVLAASSSTAAVAVKYGSAESWLEAEDSYTVPVVDTNFINLPVKGAADMIIKIKVTAANSAANFQVYKIKFTNPNQSLKWQGTATLAGDGASGYQIEGVEIHTQNKAIYSSGTLIHSEEAVKSWEISISDAYASADVLPESFTVVLIKTATGNPYRFPLLTVDLTTGGATVTPGTNIALVVTIAAASNPNLSLVVSSPHDLEHMAQNENYYLTDNIDLTELADSWNGPSNYAGIFDGNGHTITIQLSKTEGDTGMFSTLGSGAVIKNFNIVVSTVEDGIVLTAHSHFGGVIGDITQSGTYTIENVHVSGSLEYSGINVTIANGYLNVGGLVGEIQYGNKNQQVTINKCSANIDVIFNFPSNISYQYAVAGGLVGRVAPFGESNSVIIRDSYTLGSIDIKTSLTENHYAGGLIGCVTFDPQGVINTNVQIINCYSAMDIKTIKEGGTAAANIWTRVGGLAGALHSSHASAKIENSVALNPSVLTGLYASQDTEYTGDGSDNWSAGRITGQLGGNATLSGNYALSTMTIGIGSGAVVSGGESAAADGIDGGSKTAQELSGSAFWTGIGFSADIWDFTGLNIASKVYPKLRN